MKARVRVNFEFESSSIKLVVVDVEAGALQTIVARAIRQAKQQHKGVRWSSVCIVVERLDAVDAVEPEADEECDAPADGAA